MNLKLNTEPRQVGGVCLTGTPVGFRLEIEIQMLKGRKMKYLILMFLVSISISPAQAEAVDSGRHPQAMVTELTEYLDQDLYTIVLALDSELAPYLIRLHQLRQAATDLTTRSRATGEYNNYRQGVSILIAAYQVSILIDETPPTLTASSFDTYASRVRGTMGDIEWNLTRFSQQQSRILETSHCRGVMCATPEFYEELTALLHKCDSVTYWKRRDVNYWYNQLSRRYQ